jgi:hypothetical protein
MGAMIAEKTACDAQSRGRFSSRARSRCAPARCARTRAPRLQFGDEPTRLNNATAAAPTLPPPSVNALSIPQPEEKVASQLRNGNSAFIERGLLPGEKLSSQKMA